MTALPATSAATVMPVVSVPVVLGFLLLQRYLVAGLTGDGGGLLSAGTLVAFTTLQTRLLFPVVNLLRVALDVLTSLALFARIFAYLDLRPAIVDAPAARVLPTPVP